MNPFKIIGLLGLATTAIGPILTFTNTIDVSTNKTVMLVGMIVWFIGGTPWLGSQKLQPTDKEVEI